MAVAFESDGSVKSGWPMVYGTGSGYDEVFNAVDNDPTNGKVWVAGSKTTASEGKNILVLRYTGGGTQQAAFSTDYLDADDEAKDITFTKNGRVAVAGYETSSGSKLFAVVAYDEISGIGPAWTNRHGSYSEASACTYGDDWIYATGMVAIGADQGFLTKKMALGNGANDSNWGTGKVVEKSPYHFARAIWLRGTNVYVTGVGRKPDTDPAPPYNQYTTTVYSKDGAERSGFPDYFPVTPYADNAGWDVCARGVGGFYVTGDLIISDSTKHDMGTLLYSASTNTAVPGSNFTILVGTRSGNESNPLDSSDNTKLVVEHGTEPGSLAQVVSVEITGNVGTSPAVTELSFEVESLSESTIVQTVWLYNYDSGQYESFDSRAATTSDRTLYIDIPGDPDPYINGSGTVKAKLRYTVSGSPSSNWGASIDLGIWRYMN